MHVLRFSIRSIMAVVAVVALAIPVAARIEYETSSWSYEHWLAWMWWAFFLAVNVAAVLAWLQRTPTEDVEPPSSLDANATDQQHRMSAERRWFATIMIACVSADSLMFGAWIRAQWEFHKTLRADVDGLIQYDQKLRDGCRERVSVRRALRQRVVQAQSVAEATYDEQQTAVLRERLKLVDAAIGRFEESVARDSFPVASLGHHQTATWYLGIPFGHNDPVWSLSLLRWLK